MGSVQTEEEMVQRHTWQLDEKLAVVLAVLKGQESVTAICHRHGVAMAQVYRWRDAFIERDKLGLTDQRNPKHRDPVQEEMRRFRELDGSQALRIDAQNQWAGIPEFRQNGGW